MEAPLVLGIETSCDETGVGIVRGHTLLADAVASSVEEHARFGGVVPEVASRAHLESMVPTIERACETAGIRLHEIDAIAVTSGPGLAGALLVGVASAKALSIGLGKPLYGVNHLAAHVAVDQLEHGPLPEPCLAMLVSGGHSSLLKVEDVTGGVEPLGATIDDAAGECFDKTAKALGLGYPGGPALERLAASGDPKRYPLPLALAGGDDFSFSGLKTALLYKIRELGEDETERRRPDLAASYQHAIVRALTARLHEAAERTGLERLAVVGGVSANSALRAALSSARFAPLHLCTDNAAMIASAARYVEPLPYPSYLGLDAYASVA